MNSNARYYSSSLLVEINGDLREEILNWGLDYIEDKDVFTHINYPQIGREDNPHCTVLSYIIDNGPDQVQKVLAGEPMFEIELGKLSIFESDLYEVLKIDVSGDGLNRLHRVAVNTIDYRPSYYEFNPHVTISFMKKNKGEQLLKKINVNKFLGRKFKIEELCFNSPGDNQTIIDLVA